MTDDISNILTQDDDPCFLTTKSFFKSNNVYMQRQLELLFLYFFWRGEVGWGQSFHSDTGVARQTWGGT